MDYPKAPLSAWLVASFYNALVRFAVPVLVMITGALLLHRDYELTDFLKRRLSRIIWPFLFWSLIYIGYSWYNGDLTFTLNACANTRIILHQFKYGAYYHLWYVYMLIGLYLFMPVISRFVRHATEKELRYFLLVWLVVITFGQPYLSRFQPQVDVRYFGGYIGYLVLGHYLAFLQLPQKGFKLPLLIYFGLCLTGITWGTYLITARTHALSTVMYEPLGPFVILYSSAVFLLARVISLKLSEVPAKLRDLTGSFSLGIYLCHALFLTLLDDQGISYKLGNPVFSIPLTATVCFLLSFLLVFILSKIPFIGKYMVG